MKPAKTSNQSDMHSDEAHAHVTDGLHINMPAAGVKHGETLHYDQHTRSDSNEGM